MKNPPLGRFGPAVKAALICLVTCGLGLGYVWQKSQIARLGETIKKRELRLEELRRVNKRDSDELARLKSPQMLDQMVRQWRLGLEVPRPQQVVVLQEAREQVRLPPRTPRTAHR